jgi:integrase
VGLRMIQPWVNPRSKYYWFRRRVPKEYRTFGLPTEIKFSLETESHEEAQLLCQEHNLRLERTWRANLAGSPPDDLSHLQIVALAGEFYRETIATHRDDPGRALDWRQSIEKTDRRKRFFIGPYGAHLRMTFGDEAQTFLRKKGIRLVGDRVEAFVRAYLAAKENAARELMRPRRLHAERRGRSLSAVRVAEIRAAVRRSLVEVLRGQEDFAGHAQEMASLLPCALIKRTGTSDMNRITEKHLIDWRDALLASKLSPITVQDGYIAAAKSFFGWGRRMRKIETDPAAEVHVEISDRHEKEMRGFTDEEAAIILAAALAPMSELMSAENAAARRWVPWLCAYTGARVNEITQLRASDVRTIDGIPCIRITPEAGTVKTSRGRIVPLHPICSIKNSLPSPAKNEVTNLVAPTILKSIT